HTTCYFRPDGALCPGGSDAPVVVGGDIVAVAFATDTAAQRSTVTFDDIRAGHTIAIYHAAATAEVNVVARTDVDSTWTDDETGATKGVTDGSGKIDVLTNGSITVVEQSGRGDLRVGHIHATGLCTGAQSKAC